MTRRQLMMVGTYALATFGLTVGIFWPGALRAGNEQQGGALIRDAKLRVNGCELSLVRDDISEPDKAAAYQEGDAPALKLVATNPGDAEARIPWQASMSYTRPASPMSRTLPIPTILWKKSDMLVLQPHESRTIALATDTKLPKGNIMVMISSEKQSVVALRLAIGQTPTGIALNTTVAR